MKLTHYIYLLGTAAAILTACNDDDLSQRYTVGEADNAIVLGAGIGEGGSGISTRAVDDNHTGNSNGGAHTVFATGTQLRLRIDGTWTDKDNYTLSHGSVSSGKASQITTASIGDGIIVGSDTKNTHNKVEFASGEKLYWDDYGTADPNNKTTGRSEGLTIYGVAVDGINAAPTVTNWENLEWTLSQNQSTNGVWGKEDLLISNNIKAGKDGTYKFDDYLKVVKGETVTPSNLLVFTHAMSKITVKLIAGDGFPTSGVGATTKKFAAEPEVVLTSNLYGETSKTEWANTKYSVNVLTGAVVTTSYKPLAITTKTTKTDDTEVTVIKEALVMPGSTFADATEGVYPQVLSILADGNRYYVTSEKIRAAISDAITANTHANNYTTQPGKNYVFKIIVNKTGIDVSATIKDWEDVEADPVTPIINFSDCYGDTGTDFGNGFSFYRSTSVDGSYITGLTEGNTSTVAYASSKYTMTPQLYWPDHETHYFFRGVWPCVNTTNGPAISNVKANAVEISNVAYAKDKYPSDLMIGMPRKADGTLDETCKAGHKTGEDATPGICATDAAEGATHPNEGLIHMNFQFAMSQVEVELQSVTGDAAVNINASTIVELVNVYNSGEVKLSDGSVSTSGDAASYILNTVSGTGNELKRHSAIVPQTLTYSTAGADSNVRFKITVTNTDGTTDIYYADVKPIKEKDKETKVAPNGKWESGVHYKYVLTLSKTAIQVTATLKNWVTVDADEDVWF